MKKMTYWDRQQCVSIMIMIFMEILILSTY